MSENHPCSIDQSLGQELYEEVGMPWGDNLASKIERYCRAIRCHGFCIIENAIPAPLLQALNDDLNDDWILSLGDDLIPHEDRHVRIDDANCHSGHVRALIDNAIVRQVIERVVAWQWRGASRAFAWTQVTLPGGGPVPLQQDQTHGNLDNIVNAIWPLSAFTRDNGCLHILPRTHFAPAGSADDDMVTLFDVKPGSVVLMLGSTFRGRNGNYTSTARREILVRYVPSYPVPSNARRRPWLDWPAIPIRQPTPALVTLGAA